MQRPVLYAILVDVDEVILDDGANRAVVTYEIVVAENRGVGLAARQACVENPQPHSEDLVGALHAPVLNYVDADRRGTLAGGNRQASPFKDLHIVKILTGRYPISDYETLKIIRVDEIGRVVLDGHILGADRIEFHIELQPHIALNQFVAFMLFSVKDHQMRLEVVVRDNAQTLIAARANGGGDIAQCQPENFVVFVQGIVIHRHLYWKRLVCRLVCRRVVAGLKDQSVPHRLEVAVSLVSLQRQRLGARSDVARIGGVGAPAGGWVFDGSQGIDRPCDVLHGDGLEIRRETPIDRGERNLELDLQVGLGIAGVGAGDGNLQRALVAVVAHEEPHQVGLDGAHRDTGGDGGGRQVSPVQVELLLGLSVHVGAQRDLYLPADHVRREQQIGRRGLIVGRGFLVGRRRVDAGRMAGGGPSARITRGDDRVRHVFRVESHHPVAARVQDLHREDDELVHLLLRRFAVEDGHHEVVVVPDRAQTLRVAVGQQRIARVGVHRNGAQSDHDLLIILVEEVVLGIDRDRGCEAVCGDRHRESGPVRVVRRRAGVGRLGADRVGERDRLPHKIGELDLELQRRALLDAISVPDPQSRQARPHRHLGGLAIERHIGKQPPQRRDRAVGLAPEPHAENPHVLGGEGTAAQAAPQPRLLHQGIVADGARAANAQEVQLRVRRQHVAHQCAAFLGLALLAVQRRHRGRLLRGQVGGQRGLAGPAGPQNEHGQQHHRRQQKQRLHGTGAPLVGATSRPQAHRRARLHDGCSSRAHGPSSTLASVTATGSTGTCPVSYTPTSRKSAHAPAAAAAAAAGSATIAATTTPSRM